MKKFDIQLDKQARITTNVIMTMLVLFVIFVMLTWFKYPSLYNGIAFLLALGMLLACFALRIKCFVIADDGIQIQHSFKTTTILRKDIKSVEIIEPTLIETSFRYSGNGGVFGYTGKFTNRKLGKMRWYITNRKQPLVMIKDFNDATIILSPKEPHLFVRYYIFGE